MNRLAFVIGLTLLLPARGIALCPALPGPFTQGNVCPYADPSMCFTAGNANAIVQALADLCMITESNEAIVARAAQVAGDIGGTATAPQVTATHLSSPLPGAQGGLGQAQPTCSWGQFLSCNGNTCSCANGSGANTGAIAITQMARPTALDVSVEGTADWILYSTTAAGLDYTYTSPSAWRKTLGGGLIADFGFVGGGNRFSGQADSQTSTAPASDSLTNTAVSLNSHSGVYGQIGAGFRMRVPADTRRRRLRLYVGHWRSLAELRCRLTDGSLPDVVYTHADTLGSSDLLLDIVYNASRDGQAMVVSWTYSADYGSGGGNVTMHAATLSTPLSE